MHRPMRERTMAGAVEDAEEAGYDVTHRYERRPRDVDAEGNPIPGTGAIIRYSVIAFEGHVLREEAESGGWDSEETFQEEHGSRIAGHDNVIAAHTTRRAEAVTLRDAVEAAPTRTPRAGRQ